ncbi:hypothetical protein [Streptomyces luteireticuli]|uniref:Uncharacterized protein n=1 Tax=Streptomyces luteireticuli TaxID=173858 RepID=A0ABP3ILH2_9ACTN
MNTTKAVTLTAGALAAAGALVGGFLWFQAGDGGGAEDLSKDGTTKKLGIADGKGVTGRYTNDDRQDLDVFGAYGRIADPRKTLDGAPPVRLRRHPHEVHRVQDRREGRPGLVHP